MPILIVISHNSTLAQYILASALIYQNQSNRGFHIVIVEPMSSFNSRGNYHDIRPWCGTNTLNSTAQFDPFIRNEYLQQVLKVSDLFITSIKQKYTSSNVDRPSKETLEMSVSKFQQPNTIGVIYHPIKLMNYLRFDLFNTGKVTFVTSGNSIRSVVDQLPKQRTVVLNFHQFFAYNSRINYNMVINSNLSNVKYTEHNLEGPSSILWIPKMKTINASNARPEFKYLKINRSANLVEYQIENTNFQEFRDQFLVDLDIHLALAHVNFALSLIQSEIPFTSMF